MERKRQKSQPAICSVGMIKAMNLEKNERLSSPVNCAFVPFISRGTVALSETDTVRNAVKMFKRHGSCSVNDSGKCITTFGSFELWY